MSDSDDSMVGRMECMFCCFLIFGFMGEFVVVYWVV